MKTFKITALIFLILASSGIYVLAQKLSPIDVASSDGPDQVRPAVAVKPASEIVLNNISSAAGGGLWSSSSTWVGGVVPGSGDSVTIVGGSAVIIDTTASAGALTVGSGGSPAVLTFDPFSARSLTVAGDLTISGATDVFTTPSTGTVTNHSLTVGGSLTNNGILDLSTNSGQAGADLTFTGAANNTFGGSGSVTDIRTITLNKGTSSANVLDLTVSNFTVQGSTTDSAASAFLTLSSGTFKISGTFTGSHRTGTVSVDPTTTIVQQLIPSTAGIWLNNPNYTLTTTQSNAAIRVAGLLRVSTGAINTGTGPGSPGRRCHQRPVARDEPNAACARAQYADHAEQLETLFRKREGHLPRVYPAPVPDHVQNQPADHAGWNLHQPGRRQSLQLREARLRGRGCGI